MSHKESSSEWLNEGFVKNKLIKKCTKYHINLFVQIGKLIYLKPRQDVLRDKH